MKTLSAIGYLLWVMSLHGQGFGFHPVAHMAPRPPQCWVDARQFIETNAADRTVVSSNLFDYSGHGFIWKDNTTGATNIQYFTRHTGGISSFVGNTAALIGHGPNATYYQVLMLGGPGSERQVLRAKHTNQCTIAVRMWYRAGGGQICQTGNEPTGGPNYAYAQNFGGDFYWDFGPNGNNRINKVRPVGFTNAWWNVFFTRGRTNQDIWHNGTNYHSGLGNELILDGTTAPGPFVLLGMDGVTNWYIKRVVIWDYELPPADIETWNRYMTYLP